jgi:ABC-type Fe3+ transport system permease subunit
LRPEPDRAFGIRDFPVYGLPGLLLAQVLTFFPAAYLM